MLQSPGEFFLGTIIGAVAMATIAVLTIPGKVPCPEEPDELPVYTYQICAAERGHLQDWDHQATMAYYDKSPLQARAEVQREAARGRYFDCMEQHAPSKVEK